MAENQAPSEPQSPVTEAAGRDLVEAELLKVWQPGTELKSSVAESVAEKAKVSRSQVYKVRKKLNVAKLEPPAEPTKAETGTTPLQIEIAATPKTNATSETTKGDLSPGAPFEEWKTEEIEPIFKAANGLIEMAKLEGDLPTDPIIKEVASLWAGTFNAFKIRKGESSGKYLVLASATTLTVSVYSPFLFKALGKKKEKPKQEDANSTAQDAPPN